MLFLAEVMDQAENASYATFELDEATISLIRAGHAAFQAIKSDPRMDPLAIHFDCGVDVKFWEECDFGEDEENEEAAEKMKETRYAVITKVPRDLEEQEEIFCDNVRLIVGDCCFSFLGYGDEGLMETVTVPYFLLPEEKKIEVA